jgi:hypothetical protein
MDDEKGNFDIFNQKIETGRANSKLNDTADFEFSGEMDLNPCCTD